LAVLAVRFQALAQLEAQVRVATLVAQMFPAGTVVIHTAPAVRVALKSVGITQAHLEQTVAAVVAVRHTLILVITWVKMVAEAGMVF
jgi:hypothetical protein